LLLQNLHVNLLHTLLLNSSLHYISCHTLPVFSFILCNTPASEIFTLSLHDALPILHGHGFFSSAESSKHTVGQFLYLFTAFLKKDRKSTRLNSSHVSISYAVFCLKKKNKYRGQ